MLKVEAHRIIEWGDCDPAGIIYNPNIISFFDNGITLLYRAAGWSKKEMSSQFGIIGCPLIKLDVVFNRPVEYGQLVEIITEVHEVGRTSLTVTNEMLSGGVVCASGTSVRVWAGLDKAEGVIRPMLIPESARKEFCRDRCVRVGVCEEIVTEET